jgi:hypothetical protein
MTVKQIICVVVDLAFNCSSVKASAGSRSSSRGRDYTLPMYEPFGSSRNISSKQRRIPRSAFVPHVSPELRSQTDVFREQTECVHLMGKTVRSTDCQQPVIRRFIQSMPNLLISLNLGERVSHAIRVGIVFVFEANVLHEAAIARSHAGAKSQCKSKLTTSISHTHTVQQTK